MPIRFAYSSGLNPESQSIQSLRGPPPSSKSALAAANAAVSARSDVADPPRVRQRVEEARAVAWLSHNPHRVEELDAVARAGRRLDDFPAPFMQPRIRVRLPRLRVVRALVLVVRPIALVARPRPPDLRHLVGTHTELAQARQERVLGLGELHFRGQP